jgi:hypothetical protein
MGRMAQSPWFLAIAGVALLAALAGIAFSVHVVRTEGIEGLWRRKRTWIEGTQPSLKPALDEAEKGARRL